jgi:uncharacterized protein (DUF1015 family)
MAQITPFRALRYTSKAGYPEDLVTQPYDKISPEMQKRYYALNPHNIARIIKRSDDSPGSETDNVYTRAAADFNQWIADGNLAHDAEPAFYPYFQQFEHPETGETVVRKGLICLGPVVDYKAGIVHGHELTHSGPKLDRLNLSRHTRAHFGQLFLLYDDPDSTIDVISDQAAAGDPLLSVTDEYGVRHTVWRIADPAAVAQIQQAMADKKLLIADGHHRYETAQAYHHENPNLPGSDKVMMTLVNMRAPGLVVLATHRVFAGLADFDGTALLERAGKYFDIEPLDGDGALQQRLDSAPPEPAVLGLVLAGDPNAYLLTARPEALDTLLSDLSPAERRLDVVILHRALIEQALGVSEEDVRELKNISYIRGFDNAAGEVRSDTAQVAFLMRPVRPEQVAEVAFSGHVMPQKSTDFYPKLLTGLTIYRVG